MTSKSETALITTKPGEVTCSTVTLAHITQPGEELYTTQTLPHIAQPGEEPYQSPLGALLKPAFLRERSSIPGLIRVAKYPDGSTKLQGFYQWNEGFSSGFEWADIPTVQVDENGQEIKT